MEIDDGTWTLFGVFASATLAGGSWLYNRISGFHTRLNQTHNHMTSEDNKLHARIDDVREKYVRREDLDARLYRIEAGQDKLLEKLDSFDSSVRHKVNNTDQIVVRMDERLKHLEKTK